MEVKFYVAVGIGEGQGEIKEQFEILADNFEYELCKESKNYLLERNAILRLIGSGDK